MAPSIRTFLVLILAIAIGIYKVYIHNAIVLITAIGRVIQPLEDFPEYRCRRIHHPLLESCEDLWLDSTNRKLYAACSTPAARMAWCPGGNALNLAALGEAEGVDHISVLDIDHPGPAGLYGVRALEFHGGERNNQRLYLHGFDVRPIDDGRRLRFWLINHRPPLDAVTGEQLLDASRVGANSTIEVYDLDLHPTGDSNKLEYVKTIMHDAIISPNNLVVVDDTTGGFLVTNDHSTKAGVFRDLNFLFGDGSISYCRTDTGECQFAMTENCYFPNGITRDPSSGHIYIAHTAKGIISVYRLTDSNQLVQVNEIPLSMNLDNLSIDTEGNVFAGGIPDGIQWLRAFHNPYGTSAPSTVFMVRKNTSDQNQSGEYNVIKLVEDGEAQVLPATTTAVHDVVSGQVFLGGLSSPFIGVCERAG
ncbi:hypothetical protein BDV28DRAFT_127440 [Aspergillus coremiiformis]|uniref:SMP-30/Gluconolactonase/LRE-like region domain-containing protein n=1 Tax=Aspergillus coremiiformis TaxID=138285 RepID=A0A5N6ZFN9_9EURO|nr:hypothetical protein BDV28DRAFT_127440 [Aspergillus coremiiformis]